jgi:hypothetical protein
MNEPNNGRKLDLRTLAVSLVLIVGQGLVQWGITYATLSDHARRLDLIEKHQEDNSLTRTEYDKRHEDLKDELKQLRQELRELEKAKK